MKTLVAVSGSLSTPSRTTALVSRAASVAERRFGLRTFMFELGDFLPSLGLARTAGKLDPVARGRLDTLLGADALIVGSPVYKGSYTGLFKHLIDLIDPADLAGKPVLLIATGGGDRHALVIEHQLRPLFGFFEAATLPTGVYAGSGDLHADGTLSPTLATRLDRAVSQFAPWFEAETRLRAPPTAIRASPDAA